jgi:hypothetical protein
MRCHRRREHVQIELADRHRAELELLGDDGIKLTDPPQRLAADLRLQQRPAADAPDRRVQRHPRHRRVGTSRVQQVNGAAQIAKVALNGDAQRAPLARELLALQRPGDANLEHADARLRRVAVVVVAADDAQERVDHRRAQLRHLRTERVADHR